jgi:hypothetical protein
MTALLLSSLRRRARARAAVFVEAVVVISTLSLCFGALIYFRDLYLRQLSTARLARSAALAHALGACKSNSPEQWLGRDLSDYRSLTPRQQRQPVRGGAGRGAGGRGDGGRASRLFAGSGSATSDGEGLLNPITDADVSGRAQLRGGGPTRRGLSFQGEARSQSFVSCGEEVKNGDYDQLIPMIRDEASALFGMR